MNITADIKAVIDNPRALIVVSHSGGKDSQASLEEIVKIVPRDRILVVHATLGRFEWTGADEIAREHAARYDLPFRIAEARFKDGTTKDFAGVVRQRKSCHTRKGRDTAPSFPSKNNRFCTSDLKTTPIWREINAYLKETGRKFNIVVDVQGIRAQESADRAKRDAFSLNKEQSNSVKTVYTWLPIHTLLVDEVWQIIRSSGIRYHHAYDQGNERLSCLFCIYGSKNDLVNGAIAAPHIAREIDALERETGSVLHISRIPLRDLIGNAVNWN